MARVLWDAKGARRLPGHGALARAIDACDQRDVWWVCEMNSAGPIYFLPSREWLRSLRVYLEKLGIRRLLEVGAGDGFLSRCLAEARPGLEVIATDDGSWREPVARMSRRERRAYAELPVRGLELGANVQRMAARAAVRRYRPDLVLVCWAPPGALVEQMIRAPVGYVLDIGAEGDVCGAGPRTWRLAEEIVEGPLEELGLCRLDGRAVPRQTRVTLYRGGSRSV